jgi:hypothetical protein
VGSHFESATHVAALDGERALVDVARIKKILATEPHVMLGELLGS